MSIQFAVEVLQRRRDGWWVGSGLVVRRGMVLTAAHNVDGDEEFFVRLGASDERRGRVLVRGDENGIDLALIHFDAADDERAEGLGFGCVDREQPQIVERCRAIGFPRFKERRSRSLRPVRLSAQVDGHIPTAENLGHELLTLRVTWAPRDLSADESAWEGMSGAAVVTDGFVIGVITEHHLPEGDSALTVVPVSAIAALPEASRWWELLGVASGGLQRVPPTPTRPRPAYLATIEEMAPTTLIGRQQELAVLGEFVTGARGYHWLVGGPWTGKTALMARFVSSCPPEVDVVAYFLVRRRRDADAARFLRAVNMQLEHLLNIVAPPGDQADVFRALWARATDQAKRSKRHLLLMVDGLDEDDGQARALPSVAQLLPIRAGGNSHVLVSSRRYPLIPGDVDVEHPLRRVKQIPLTASNRAAELKQRARQDLDALLGGGTEDKIATDLLGLLAAARGPLSVTDLTQLARMSDEGVRRPRVSQVVEQHVARVLEPAGAGDEPRFAFAHDTLRERVEKALGADVDAYQQHLHVWAGQHEAAGWPMGKVPRYLLDTYPAFLLTAAPKRLDALYGDLAYVEEAIRTLGVGRVCGDLHEAAAVRSSELVSEASRVLDRALPSLRFPRPIDRAGYASFQLCLEALRGEAVVLADRTRRRLAALPAPQVVPRWTSARTTTALLRDLQGHGGAVRSVAVDAAATHAVSASDDRTLRVWDLATGKTLTVLVGHAQSASAVAMDSAGTRAVSGSDDRTVRVWDLATGNMLSVLHGHKGRVLGVGIDASATRAVSGSTDRTVRVWDLSTGQMLHVLEGHTGPVRGVAMNASATRAISASDDQTLRVWDLSTGQTLHVLEGHTRPVRSVSIDAMGDRAVSASEDWTLRVWHLGTGHTLTILNGHTQSVSDVAMGNAAMRVVSASADATLRVWDNASGRTLTVLKGPGPVRGVAIDAAATRAVSASDDSTLHVWDLTTSQNVAAVDGHTSWVRTVTMNAAGNRAVSGSDDRTLRVWDIATGRALCVLEGHSSPVLGVAMDATATRAISASEDCTLRVWDLATGQTLTVLKGHSGWATGVAINAAATRAVSASYDRTLRVWDLATGQTLTVLRGHHHWVTGVAMNAAATRAVSSSEDRTLRVWDLTTGRTLTVLRGHSEVVTDVAIDAAATCAVSSSDDQTLRVWDLATGQVLTLLDGHTAPVSAVAMDVTGTHAVSASEDQTLRVWDLVSGRCVGGPYHMSAGVLSVAFLTLQPGLAYVTYGDYAGAVSVCTLRLDTASRGPLAKASSLP